jgi:ABC-type dipeptide/oligopeptide/nickel transport system permease component
MLTLIGKRLMMALPSLIGVIIVTFILTRALPGDPAAYFAGPAATKEAVEQVRAKLGLDRPLPIQFVGYVTDLAQGNFGTSLTTGQPVLTEIRNRLPASAELTLLGLMVSMMVALPLGMLAALRPGSAIDHFCRIVTTAGVSLPVFSTSPRTDRISSLAFSDVDEMDANTPSIFPLTWSTVSRICCMRSAKSKGSRLGMVLPKGATRPAGVP